jgi:DNA-binding NtrC family response regulator
VNPHSQPSILVVDDDAGMRVALDAGLRQKGWQVESAAGVEDALQRFRRSRHAVVVSDVRMGDGDGLEVMRGVRRIAPNTAVILLTAYACVADAVGAIQAGAVDYLVKPVSFEQLQERVAKFLQLPAPGGGETHGFIGRSPALQLALEQARRAAGSNADILIEAESGTGKELLARMIHALSPRAARPFVPLNCAAFPETLLESELFGHVKGAFTGAAENRPGKFQQADGGTLLLDEIGEMPLNLQPKLLRALQEREFDRLGGRDSVKVDLRVIATTNRPLRTMVREGSFRADLFYRLNVIPLTLPPLRERAGDIAELARHFMGAYSLPPSPVLSPQFEAALARHSWPGNVRELANCMRRTAILRSDQPGSGTDDLLIEPFALDLQPSISVLPAAGDACVVVDRQAPSAASGIAFQAGVSLGEMERKLLELTLNATRGNRSRAAEMLGISLRTVRNKIRDYGLPGHSSYLQEKLCR